MSLDSEKYAELQSKIAKGESPNDEGPYYHHSWWESYKGGIKGKLGGAVIGGLVGAAIGLAAGVIIPLIAGTVVTAGAVGLTVAAFAAAGTAYGAHEFGDVGKITGAVAASHKQAELRMKAFEEGKFSELKQDIGELKSMIGGKPVQSHAKPQAAAGKDYRTTHYAKLNTPESSKLVFWKIALIGVAVGATAGALLGVSGLAVHLLDGLLGAGALSEVGVTAASTIAFGALGASFGINRDIFRKVFDTTDLWIKGMLSHDKVKEHQIAAGELLTGKEKTGTPEVVTAVLPHNHEMDFPISATHHRDRVLADRALLNFDHTRATPQ